MIIAALAAPLALSGCEAVERDYAQAVEREQRAEQVIEDVLLLPDGTPGRAALIADAREAEAEAEALRKRIAAVRRDALTDAAIDGVGDAARGDWLGLIEGLGALVVAAGTYALARKSGKSELDARLTELERRRDESREMQDIAPAYMRSGKQVQSPVARAAAREEDARLEAAIDRRMGVMPTAASYGIALPPDGVASN